MGMQNLDAILESTECKNSNTNLLLLNTVTKISDICTLNEFFLSHGTDANIGGVKN
jgi:hypothetical protein